MPETQPDPLSDFSQPELSKRALQGLLILVLLTVASLAMAWYWVDITWLHFLWVTQVVPVLYWVLMWWGTTDIKDADDGI